MLTSSYRAARGTRSGVQIELPMSDSDQQQLDEIAEALPPDAKYGFDLANGRYIAVLVDSGTSSSVGYGETMADALREAVEHYLRDKRATTSE